MASRSDEWRRLIRQRLARAPQPADASAALFDRIVGQASAEFESWLEQPSRSAAVLLGLVDRAGGPSVLLTERAAHLPHHPGQVSLPGGRLEADESAEAAALREACEEVALASARVDILGCMPPQLTGTGFCVTPVVGWIDSRFEPEPDPAEVQAVFEVPLDFFAQAGNRRRATRVRWNTRFVSDEFRFDRFRIWGATAAILSSFVEIIYEETGS